jgi:hypothetical protein
MHPEARDSITVWALVVIDVLLWGYVLVKLGG